MSHIQKMAPGPPSRIAPLAPTMLPVPTCAATAVASAWKELIEPCFFSPLRLNPPKSERAASPKQRTWTNRVRMLKKRPAPMSRTSST